AYAQAVPNNACEPTQVEAEAAFSSAKALEGYSDVCSGTNLTATLTNTLVEGNDCDWTVTYTYTVFDECLNPLTGQTYVETGSDDTFPVVTAPSTIDIECSNAAPVGATTIVEFLALSGAAASDNCTPEA